MKYRDIFTETKNPANKNILLFILVVLTVIAYFPITQAGFIWDDFLLTDNPLVTRIDGIKFIWTSPSSNVFESHYWPVVYSMFWLEYRIWGDIPLGYHLVNLLFHILNVLLLWKILDKLQIKGAWLASLLFAIHPVHVESVAWVLERKDVLSGFFYLFSLLSFLTYRESHKQRDYWLSLLLFLFALLSKTVAITLPVILILLFWWKNQGFSKKNILELIPFWIIAFVYGIFDLIGVRGKVAVQLGLSMMDRFLIAGHSLWFYFVKIIWPYPLSALYQKQSIEHPSLLTFLYPLSIMILPLLLFIYRNRIGKAPLVGCIFFIITLFPMLGFVDFAFMTHSYVADRFQYLASIGPLAWISGLLLFLLNKYKTFFYLFIHLLILILVILTFRHSMVFKDDETLCRQALIHNPTSWLAYNNLGMALESKNQNAEALQCFKESLRLHPSFADPYNNIGNLLVGENKLEEAIHYYSQATLLKPRYPEAYNNLGVAFAKQGKMKEAIEQFQKALAINPLDSKAQQNLEKANSLLKP